MHSPIQLLAFTPVIRQLPTDKACTKVTRSRDLLQRSFRCASYALGFQVRYVFSEEAFQTIENILFVHRPMPAS